MAGSLPSSVVVYATNVQYIAARDQEIKTLENNQLLQGTDASAGNYGFGVAHTIGYGCDFSRQSGAQIIADFSTAGIPLSADQTSALQDYSTLHGEGLGDVDIAFFKFSITAAQAQSLLTATAPRYEQA